jgi:hypothetical protein
MTARWMKPAVSTYAPTRILTVVCGQRPVVGDRESRHTDMILDGVATAYSYKRRNVWSKPEFKRFNTGIDLHSYVDKLSQSRRKLYVFTPTAGVTLSLTGFFGLLSTHTVVPPHSDAGIPPDVQTHGRERTIAFNRLVLNTRTNIISYSKGNGTTEWCSCAQYLACGEQELGSTMSFSWPLSGGPLQPGQVRVDDIADRADLWLRTFQRLSDWWISVDGGPWSATVGGLSMSYFRRRLTPKTILLHDNENARILENDGLFGGRASVWYYGDVSTPRRAVDRDPTAPPPSIYPSEVGPALNLDVQSMYPYLLASRDYPVRLLSVRAGRSVDEIRGLLPKYGVIARVELSTPHPEYCYRAMGRVVWPTGDFTTVLCGPELERAIHERSVVRVYDSAVYAMGQPFKRQAEDLLKLRQESRSKGDRPWEMFVKLLSNNLGGKLAQKRSEWHLRPHVRGPVRWGEWYDLNIDTGELHIYSSIAGMVREKVVDPVPKRLVGAAFAYLTAYGRDMMRTTRESLPPRTVVSQDTDGLWVIGLSVSGLLQAFPDLGRGAGSPRVVATVDSARFFSPKVYWTSDGWVRSGLHGPIQVGGPYTLQDSYQTTPLTGCPAAPPDRVTVHTRIVNLQCEFVDGRIGPSGWADPTHLVGSRELLG